ncbi:MAG TPA: TOMM precursor leader peptide-binding protein [Pyrinomonadaceae bacterium]|nr:TOMM precursor leader peptide-binding protein [Pyrinomonadaceae bacterium]
MGPEDALSQVLREAFQQVLFFPDKTLPATKSDLTIGVFAAGNYEARQSFLKWAYDAEVPALSVEPGNDAALIGPLTLSGRPGCGWCAFERIQAALATKDAAAMSTRALDERFGPALVREVRAIVSEPEHSSVLDHVLVVDAETLDESLHKIIPLARCSVCGGAAAYPSRDQENSKLSSEDSPEEVLGALAGWVDSRTGVISDLFIEPPEIELPVIATAAPPHIIEKDGSLRRLPLGWGKGLTVSGAVLSAVGEAIERYSASIVDTERIVWKRAQDLEGEFLDPREFGLYTDTQYGREDFPYVRFDTAIEHPWVSGHWLDNEQQVWIPAILVFLSIELRQEQLICQGTSNGLAASSDKDDASLRAVLELVERDAFLATWLTGSVASRIELDDTFDPQLRTVIEGIESLGAAVEIYSLPVSVIGTTILCLAFGDGENYPGVTFGLGSDLELRAALKQAILELGQTGPYLRHMMQSKLLTTPRDPSAVREMLDHAAYYFLPERASAFDRLRSNKQTVRLAELKSTTARSLQECVAALREAGVRVAIVDVTSADVATGPFRVMRAVSPDLQPIWFGYGLERTPVERIRKMKVAADVPPINPIW